MCWTYETQIICTICRAVQPGVYARIEYRDPGCEKPCHKPWPMGKPEADPRLGDVDASQCSFCKRTSEPIFLKEKQGQEDFVRKELDRVKMLLFDRAEEKRKRREKRLKRSAARQESDEQEADGTTQEEPEVVDSA